MPNKPRIIVFDIETSPVINAKFQFSKNPFISHDSIIQDWYIISAAWKVVGEKEVHAVWTSNLNDFNVVKKLRNALASADILVGHNCDKFDIKCLTTRLIYHSLPPLPLIPTIDTFKETKKVAAFTSNKLDYLSKILTNGRKIHVDFQLWMDVVVNKSKEALTKMIRYNKGDVVVNEKLYTKLVPYMKNPPHMGVMMGKDRKLSCQKCGSENIKKNGVRVTAAGMKKQECQCQDCGGYMRIPIVNI